MKTIRYRSKDSEVYFLEEILTSLGYEVYISTYFGMDTHRAVLDFQLKNGLVSDGIVGLKTWTKLILAQDSLTGFSDKFLSEQNLIDFADKYEIELAAVKAVNEIESNGKGFLLDGRPRILFEGHIFWRELKNRGLIPNDFLNSNTENVLYEKWTRNHYVGGGKEYDRLERAAAISDDKHLNDSAYSAASYGSFQIMGFHYKLLGYPNVNSFVSDMYTHEKAHLEAFGRFCKANNLIRHLKSKNWAAFAKGYNGSGYKENKYDTKLESAYNRYK
ncbi:N-acetylmuramidase domain-containing protein [Ulvibacter antarcticus]|uniref:Peptidoglycan hydrolase-like protein with peptidoglycan-binding domain n=1 Tax=Ulvibacter antarcticus TaxID=442714 RepID=A0A3L9YHC5_9FLAO|nr:N-acetylmuramidase family protein [Ulvibacter antarcticus]RMA58860.1 peptidoglycan hydrolase-like protein with peptidoglycan-binding domain [Ulvibacter antarcticus]